MKVDGYKKWIICLFSLLPINHIYENTSDGIRIWNMKNRFCIIHLTTSYCFCYYWFISLLNFHWNNIFMETIHCYIEMISMTFDSNIFAHHQSAVKTTFKNIFHYWKYLDFWPWIIILYAAPRQNSICENRFLLNNQVIYKNEFQ